MYFPVTFVSRGELMGRFDAHARRVMRHVQATTAGAGTDAGSGACLRHVCISRRLVPYVPLLLVSRIGALASLVPQVSLLCTIIVCAP